MGTKSSKHARKVKLDSSINNAIAHAVDARKVASFTASAAGVIAGAALALGTTPAVAVSSVAQSGNDQNIQSNLDNTQSDSGADANGAGSDGAEVNRDGVNGNTPTYSDRSATPAPAPKVNSEITISQETKDTLPNLYAWGSSDNVYIEKGQNQAVTFKFAKPTDGSTITKVAIFPSDGNTVDNTKSRRYLEYYSASDEHQPYSGTYDFQPHDDGSATLTMTSLYRNNNMPAVGYAANRCIYVYGMKDGKEVLLYKTNIVRAATLVPPKTAGSIVLKYNEALTEKQIQDKLKAALDAPTEATGKQSIREQITVASKSKGVGVRNVEAKTFTNTPDDPENKVIINNQRAYLPTELTRFNRTTSKQGAAETTYITTVQTLKTHLITDTGYTSDDLPLTVARYDTRIQKPVVEETDPSKVSDEVKTDIKKKLSRLNHVPEDSVVINNDGTVAINFTGVDEKDAPKIPLRNLVLKKFAEKDISVPANDKAVFVSNPLGYSKAEIDRIKQAILDANKENKELGLTSKDQITLEYVTGDTTVGHENIGISNGQAENKITVKIKTDKSVAEFTSNVKESKLTKLPNIRTDYEVTWKSNKIDGRDTDEGISWSNDKKTTIIYRYDPTKAEEFDTNKILGLLKATPKDKQAGLRELTGGEQLTYEGTGNNARKSHMHYALQNGEPTGELTLGNMSGAYWQVVQKVSNSGEKLGDNLSEAGSYTWDPEAGSVIVAAKQNKVFKARLFVEPYGMTYYKDVYLEQGRNPGNTAKAINVIFVPQTNHKTNDLKKSVLEHKTTNIEGKDIPTDSAYYNASEAKKAAYDDALKVAQQTLAKVGTTTDDKLSEQLKAEVDNATIKLDKARAELDGAKTIKDGLDQSIADDGTPAEGQQATTGTKASDKYKNVTNPDFKDASGNADTKKNEDAKKAKEAYDKALEEANKVKADDNATQKAVDDAKANLDKARQALNEFSTNKDKLNAAIAEHGKVKNGKDAQGAQTLTNADPAYQNATKEERNAYDEAVKKANDLLADPNASQKEVNEAIAALEKAKKALDAKATDKSQLITAEKLTFDNPEPDKPNGKKSTFYKNAFDKQTSGANDQEKQAAKTAVDNYNNALDNARKVLKNDKATQAEVDDAKKKLEAAEKVLHEKYASNADELTKVLADNFSGYLMPAYFNAFDKAQAGDNDAKKAFKDYNDAYQKAKELKQKLEEAKNGGTAPDQRLINEAKTALEKARTVIDKYATNTSRLSAAVFNDLAIQNSPAYKNASADDASVEAKAAKTRYDKAVEKLHQALNKQMPKDQANGKDIPDTNTPEKDGNLDDKDYLKNIQAHAQGEPLDRDIDAILKEMNEAAAELNKFATKTDDLLKSINEDAVTHQNPAFKNASHPDYKQADGTTANKTKNDAAKKAVDDYGKALNEAKDLLKNPSATQKQVNDAKDKLDKARAELNKYNTDTAKLKESVKKHGSTDGAAPTEGTQTSDAYRNASDPHFLTADGKPDEQKNTQAAADKKAYDEALTKAQELLKKHDDANTPQDAKPTQADIDAALNNLDAARKKLEDNYKTDTTKLDEEAKKSTAEGAQTVGENDFENTPEFKNAKAKTSDGQTNADVAAYQKALKKAHDLVKAAADQGKKNSERPTQQQINEALDALKAAKKQITDNYKTNLEPLTSAKDFAGGDFKKTPEYLNAVAKKDAGDQGATQALGEAGQGTGFDNVLKKVADKLNDDTWKAKATQKEVNALLKQLKDAQDNIAKKYKTDAIKLEREVGDKDQDGNPVVPPFEASVAYKNALEKAKTESEEDAKKDTSATKKLKEYADKLKAAQELLNKVNNPDPNADPASKPTQKQVDDALDALKKAKKDIDDNFKTKVDDLQKEADDKDDKGVAKNPTFENTTEFANLKDMTKDGNKPDDLVAYEKALAKAKELIDKNDGKVKNADGQEVDVPKDQLPSQKEVDDALQTLKKIKEKILANYKTKVNDLKTEAAKSKDENSTPGSSTTPSTDTKFEDSAEFKNADAKKGEGGKENADVTAYKEALKKARTLLNKFDENGKPKQGETSIPTQKEVDAALDALKAAKNKITESYKTNKSALESETGKDSDFKKSVAFMIGRKDDLDAYKKALEEAKKVLNDPNATQAQVDAALKALQDAKNRIISYYGVGGIYDSSAVDKSELQKEVNNSGDASAKANAHADSAASKAYKKALANAQRVLADPNATQAQVDAALKALRDAKAALQDYANSSSQNNANGKLPNTGLNATFFASFSALFAAMGIGIVSTRRKHSKR
ncbi:FIVAR domain-containing protein [Gardnerella sp. DNF00502]|uniref:FIVAR domain-containing protein n=1 Tax=unclassified Gardnerella TaxID=2628112 RepID=UPI000C9F6708|nr:FIVAR domain-containing protein [Gardnerella sp. KA00735]PNP89435.1 peptidase [Gardnerella sp. KA00735]